MSCHDRVSGSLYGRAIGVGLCYMWQSINGTPYPTGKWRWLDPGVMSAIGAAGLLGGVNRIATASTVIVVCNNIYCDRTVCNCILVATSGES